jgi:hypothetical protein
MRRDVVVFGVLKKSVPKIPIFGLPMGGWVEADKEGTGWRQARFELSIWLEAA